MPRTSLDRIVDRRLSEADRASDRFSDLQVAYVDESNDRLIARVGGRWDKRAKIYIGDAPTERVIRLHPGQIDFAEWFLNTWLDAHLDGWPAGQTPIYTALVAGGRRGGKTREVCELTVGYAAAIENGVTWIITPSDVEGYGEELRTYLERTMPASWYTSLGSPHWSYRLVNGHTIRMLSGFTPGKVKKGGASLVFMNEAQQIPKTTYDHVRASIADYHGLVIAAANPPDVGDKGTWIADVAAETINGVRPNAKAFFIDPLTNPHIDQQALLSLQDSMSEHEFDVQIRGKFLVPKDAVLHAWDRTHNEKRKPETADITREFTQHHEKHPYDHVVAIDVQNFPWIVAAVAHAYPNPFAPGNLDDALLWFTDEVFIEKGDEIDCALELKAKGYDPATTLLVCDASGDWQQAERKKEDQRPEYKGAGSFDMFRGAGYRHVVTPDPYMDANPRIDDRLRGANARIGTKSRRRFVYADPVLCPRLTRSISLWRNVNGRPSRHGKDAHAGDAITYLIWRFNPRRGYGGDGTVTGTKRPSRFEGEKRMKGW